jgi:hypothetical protein
MDTLSHTVLTRRSALRSAAGVGLATAAALPLALLAVPAKPHLSMSDFTGEMALISMDKLGAPARRVQRSVAATPSA